MGFALPMLIQPIGGRKVLFAAHPCYLDDSNGAAVASRAMMEALARSGFAVEVFTGTTLELHPGVALAERLADLEAQRPGSGDGALAVDARGWRPGPAPHLRLVLGGVSITLHRSTAARSQDMGEAEMAGFLGLHAAILDGFRPDILVNYGGDTLAHHLRSMARSRGVAVVFALHNFQYTLTDPFTTVDAVLVPSRYAAEHYRKTLGLDCAVLPYLIDLDRVRVDQADPKYVTFVNPSYEKGVYVFARLADELGRRRPDIPLLVVEGRGSERTLVDCGIDLRAHGNVHLMSHTSDPRKFWGVTRLCLVPSLWRETQGLVAVEAMLNGIPVIASDRGALPETLGGAGVVLPLPGRLSPYTRNLPTPAEVAPWVEAVIRLWDDPAASAELSRRGLAEAGRWNPAVLEPAYVNFFNEVRVGGHRLGFASAGPDGSRRMPAPGGGCRSGGK